MIVLGLAALAWLAVVGRFTVWQSWYRTLGTARSFAVWQSRFVIVRWGIGLFAAWRLWLCRAKVRHG